MFTTNLRKVGGSVMLAVPPAMLEAVNLSVGSKVGISVENWHLVIEPQIRPRYTLEELLSLCDTNAEFSDDENEWLNDPTVGRELI